MWKELIQKTRFEYIIFGFTKFCLVMGSLRSKQEQTKQNCNCLKLSTHVLFFRKMMYIWICVIKFFALQGELEEALKEFQTLVDEDHRDFRPYLCMVCSCCYILFQWFPKMKPPLFIVEAIVLNGPHMLAFVLVLVAKSHWLLVKFERIRLR